MVEEEQWQRKLYYSAIHGESEEEGRRESEKEWESEGGVSARAQLSQSEERHGQHARARPATWPTAPEASRPRRHVFRNLKEVTNTTTKIHKNINLPPFVTPNLFSFGTSGSNKSCRAT